MASKLKHWKDRGDSTLISTLIVLPIILAVLWSSVDAFMYFTNRSMMISAARDGARTVAIMGGNGTATRSTPIEREYGQTKSAACGGLTSEVVAAAVKPDTTPIECNVLQTVSEGGFAAIKVTSVKCTPPQTTSISQRTQCKIQYDYNSVPGSPLGFIKKPRDDGKTPEAHDQSGFSGAQLVVGTSESEVDLTGITDVPRA